MNLSPLAPHATHDLGANPLYSGNRKCRRCGLVTTRVEIEAECKGGAKQMPVTDTTTRSLTVRAAPGLMDVYSSTRDRMIMLVVRREPNDIYETRNVEMTPADARDLADRLLAAAKSVE